MRLDNGRLTFETRPCLCAGHGAPCPPGRQAGLKACPECNGSGDGKRGGKGQCKKCYGNGKAPDFVNHVRCCYCEGTAIVPETITDSLPPAIWKGLPFRVLRCDRQQTLNEEWLAAGMCWSSTDYGRAWKGSDEDLLAAVRDGQHYVQACKVAKDDGTLCDAVAITVLPNGYTVQGVFSR